MCTQFIRFSIPTHNFIAFQLMNSVCTQCVHTDSLVLFWPTCDLFNALRCVFLLFYSFFFGSSKKLKPRSVRLLFLCEPRAHAHFQ